mgnify:CR=1 FL=1
MTFPSSDRVTSKTACFAPLLILACIPIDSISAKFKGVNAMLETEDMADPFIVSSVFQRCAGVYGALAKILPSGDPTTSALKQTSFSLTTEFGAGAIIMLNVKNQNTGARNQEQVMQAVKSYIDIYYREMNQSQINTGSIFSEWGQAEFSICNQLRPGLDQLK